MAGAPQFDPDAFMARKAAASFDPDAFMARKAASTNPDGYLSQVGAGLWNTVKGLAQVGVETGGAVFDPLNAVEHLKNLKRMVLDPQVDQAIKAADEWKKGNRSESVGHALAAVLPGVGPAAANIGEKLGNQDYTGAAADATVLGATMAAPKVLGEIGKGIAKTAETAGTIKQVVTNPEVARAALEVVPKGPAIGKLIDKVRAVREAMGTSAAATETPGMILARESNMDWANLSATDQGMLETLANAKANVVSPADQAMAERIAKAKANYAARPPMGPPQAPTEPTVPAGPAPRAPLFPDLPSRPRSPLFPDLPPPESGPPAAPAPEPAPVVPPTGGKPAAADVAAQLEASMRTDALTDYIVRNKIPAAMLDEFGPEQWDMVSRQAGVKPPTPENIQAIRGNLAQYEGASQITAKTPAEAAAEFETKNATRNARKPKAAAPAADVEAQLADSLAAVEKGERPVAQVSAQEGPAKPTASEGRVNAFAERLAAEQDIPLEDLATIAQNPDALRYMDNLGRSLGIQGSLAPGDVAHIVARVKELRGASAPPAATTLRDLMQPEPPKAAAPRARRSKPIR